MDIHITEPVDRAIDFDRTRWLRCRVCLHSWEVGWDFIEEWDDCQTGCPSCGILANHELVTRPPYIQAPNEAMADDALVRKSSWFHTSFHSDWPRANYNPLDDYSPAAAKRILEDQGGLYARWAPQQENKALHVGTYEAAVANLYRRLDGQTGYHDLNFHIYRLQLSETAIIQSGIFPELSNCVGDVDLDEVCPWPNEVTRYVNIREDESSVSLAVRRSAIFRVQSVKLIDLPVDPAEVEMIKRRIEKADALPPRPPRKNMLGSLVDPQPNRVVEGHGIAIRLRTEIPWRIREHFDRGVMRKLDATTEPEIWARWLLGVRELAINPSGVLEALNTQPWVMVDHSE